MNTVNDDRRAEPSIALPDSGRALGGSDPRGPFAVLILGFVGANVSIPLIAAARPGAMISACLAGAVLGSQLSLVAAWGVFGAAPFLTRLSRCAALGFGTYASLMTGAGIIISGSQLATPGGAASVARMMLVFLMILPLIFFSVQMPLWGFRIWLGWETTQQPREGSYGRPIMIKDFFLATIVFSVSLALVRVAAVLAPQGDGPPPSELFALAGVLSAVSVGASLITIPPLIYAVLGFDKQENCAIAAAAWTGVMCVICWTPILIASYAAPQLGLLISVTLMNLAYTGLVSLGLLLVRRRGYRLRLRRRSPSTPSA